MADKKRAKKKKSRKNSMFRWDKEKATDFFLMTTIILLIAVFGYYSMMYSEGEIRHYTLENNFDLLVITAAIFGVLVVAFRRFFPAKYYAIKKAAYFVILFPFAILPIFNCYFSVPFIFCKVCPQPCLFGVTRFFSFSGFFLMNLREKHFCNHMCPLGTMQDKAGSIMSKKLRLAKWTQAIRWLFLVAIVGIVAMTETISGVAKLGVTAKAFYWPSITVVSVFFVVLLSSYFVPRVFCNYFCPVGSVGDLMLWVQKKVFRRK